MSRSRTPSLVSPARPVRVRNVLVVLLLAALAAGCGEDGGGGATDAGAADVALPPCDDGDPCTTEERTAVGCTIVAVDDDCRTAGWWCCAPVSPDGRDALVAQWSDTPCTDRDALERPLADCGTSPDGPTAACCELEHPNGARTRLLWGHDTCVALGGRPLVPSDCTALATDAPVCCDLPREGGEEYALYLGHAECSERHGSEVAAERCDRASAPVCCTLPNDDGATTRTRILALPDCLTTGGAAALVDTCDPACERPCDTRQCGPDPCGGFCGECDGDLLCTSANTCELTATPGETVCCARLAPEGTPRDRWLALRADCEAAEGTAAQPLSDCDAPFPEPGPDDDCCEWPGPGEPCEDAADCPDVSEDFDECVVTAAGAGVCTTACDTTADCPEGWRCGYRTADAPGDSDICRPMPLWWPAACTTAGATSVPWYRCRPHREREVCCQYTNYQGTLVHEPLPEESCLVHYAGEILDDAECAD